MAKSAQKSHLKYNFKLATFGTLSIYIYKYLQIMNIQMCAHIYLQKFLDLFETGLNFKKSIN